MKFLKLKSNPKSNSKSNMFNNNFKSNFNLKFSAKSLFLITMVVFCAGTGMFVANVGVASATDYYVSTSGDNSDTGLSIDHAWATPSYAAQQAEAGDTIYLIDNPDNPDDGIWYDEYVVFSNSGNTTHPITMTAYNGTPTLDGNGNGIAILMDNKEHIKISNLKIINYYDGIYPKNDASDIEISNNYINASHRAVNTEKTNITLHNNTILSGYSAVSTTHYNYNTIYSDNTVLEAGWNGLTLNYAHDSTAYNNEVTNTYHNGMQISNDSTNCVFKNNIVHESNCNGYYVTSFPETPCRDTILEDCTVYNSKAGIATDSLKNFTVRRFKSWDMLSGADINLYRVENAYAIDCEFDLEHGTYDFYVISANNTNAINTKFLTDFVEDSDFTVYYYIDILVQDENGDPIEGANVTVTHPDVTIDYYDIPLTVAPINLHVIPREFTEGHLNPQPITTTYTGVDGHTPLPSDSDNTFVIADFRVDEHATPRRRIETYFNNYTITAEKDGFFATVRDINPNASWYREDPNTHQNTVILVLGPDTAPPYTSGHNPTKGVTGVVKNTNIETHIKDDKNGVDQSSIVMTVEGIQVAPTITGAPNDYTLTYAPLTDFYYNQVVNVTIDAQDLASPANVMIQDSYSFTIQSEPVAGLVGHWKFDEGFGTTAYDSSRNGNEGTINGASWTEGKLGKALSFDGADDYVDCGSNPSLNITDAITIEAWVKPDAWDAWDRVISKGDTATLFQYTIGMSAGNNLGTRIILNGTLGGGEIDGYNPPIGEWTHIVTTFDKTTTKMYINGVSQTISGPPNFGASVEGLKIGRRNNAAGNWFDGSIDDVGIYSRALTASEVLAHYNEGNVSDTTPPTGSIQINSGNQKTNSQTVSLTISANDESGLSEMKISETNDFSSAIAETYSTIKTFILSPIDGLKTVYIWFKDTIGNWNTSPYSDTIILDTTSPTISNISISNITTNTVLINFQTNEESYSYLEYGLTPSYGSASALDSALATIHSISLSGLSADTNYHFKIISKDALENESNSIDQTFKTIGNPDTIPPSKITDLSSSNITQTSADLNWTSPGDDNNTGTASTYDIRYSTSNITESNWNSATQISGEPIPQTAGTEQSIYIAVGLSSNTNYYFAIKTSDEVPNVSDISNILSLKTLAASVPPSSGGGTVSDTTPPSQPSSFQAIPADSQITLNWKNPNDLDFVRVKILRKEGSTPTSHNDTLAKIVYEGTKEQYTDIELNNNTTYYYSIFAYDKKPNYSKILSLSSKPEQGKTSIKIPNGSSSYPEGTLLKTADSFKIYIIINQKKKWIPTPEVFETLGYQWTNITIIDKNQLTLIPDYEDNLIRALNDFKVYLIVNGIKRHIPNPEIFLNYGFEWNEVKDVSQETINQYTQANLIKESKKEEIYYLCPERKIKRWLRSPEIFNSYPDNNWNNIQVISKYEMDHYPTSNLIQLIGDNNVYLIENNRKRLINSVEEFEREGLDWGKVMGVGLIEINWFIL